MLRAITRASALTTTAQILLKQTDDHDRSRICSLWGPSGEFAIVQATNLVNCCATAVCAGLLPRSGLVAHHQHRRRTLASLSATPWSSRVGRVMISDLSSTQEAEQQTNRDPAATTQWVLRYVSTRPKLGIWSRQRVSALCVERFVLSSFMRRSLGRRRWRVLVCPLRGSVLSLWTGPSSGATLGRWTCAVAQRASGCAFLAPAV